MRVIHLLVVLILLVSTASAADVYRVPISSGHEAALLRAAGVEPVIRLNDGYLVLAKEESVRLMAQDGLAPKLIASDIDRGDLALDNRLDRANVGRYELLFEDGEVRLYRVDWSDPSLTTDQPSLRRLPDGAIPIVLRGDAVEFDLKSGLRGTVVPLDSLAALVSQDTLYNYVSTLQAFGPRVQGSPANFNARDWIYSKFVGYGYDSVYLDPFGSGYNNVVCVKLGTRFPDHQVVVGGHFDAVSGSPGADDNGSGTAATMEMARILAEIETDMTFIFIAFDAEESGLNGSEHYADAALAAGDNIRLMFNMDMIANEGNTTDVKTYHGDNMEFPNLFNQLADSLVGLTGHNVGNISASDHWPFHQNGYTIVMAHEYIFSSVYHSSQDNVSHMDFPYMTKIVKAGLATCYVVSQTTGPLPSLAFDYPEGVPTLVLPGVGTTFEVDISGLYDGIPVPGTGQLHYNVNNHGWVQTAMTELTDNHYQAWLPGAPCYSPIEFFITADEASEGEYRDPDPLSPPYVALVATGEVVAFEDDFESAAVWSFSGGQWAIGTPTGGGGDYGNPDPNYAVSGVNILGYNLNGDYGASLPEYHATSPAIDCSDLVGTKLSFWRYLGVEQPSYDHAYVRVSTNGTTWTTLWENTATIEDNAYSQWSFDISSIADGAPAVYVRFTMGTTDGSWQYCGWNIDDVRVTSYVCNDLDPQITTESLPDWTVGVAYSQQLEAIGGTGNLTWTDKNGDLIGTGLSISSDGLVSGPVAAAGSINFTALVEDEAAVTDEKPFSFAVNPAVVITTEGVPDGVAGVEYDFTLAATGGTGTLTWVDKYGDLDDTGIALLPTGQLYGYPLAAGPISFTAEVSDAVGDVEERLYTFNIAATYICGDANGNGIGPDIEDLVYLVNYMFNQGPQPPELAAVDVNGNGAGPDIEDLVYLVSFMFSGGPALNCP
ncbi:MAG: M28 family peptidase [bacterium]